MQDQDSNKEINQIVEWIKADLDNELSQEQRVAFQQWLKESEENQHLYERIKSSEAISERLHFRNSISLEEDWVKLSKMLKEQRVASSKSKRFIFFQYAAVAAVFVGIVSLFLVHTNDDQVVLSQDVERIEVPGSEVILTLANGDKVSLGNEEKRDIVLDEGHRIKDSFGELSYTAPKEAATSNTPSLYHTISVPRGGEYKVKLEDGTEVYLNADSELKFPEFFADDIRFIELKGEAYLKVSRDSKRPFKVKVNNMIVEVLGTEFNLRAYRDEDFCAATLVEGAVKVMMNNDEVEIKPGQQAYVNKEEKMEVKTVDVHAVIGWMNGDVVFRNESLDAVLKTVSRWYDVEFDYVSPQVKNFRITGRVRKLDDVMETLATIEKINAISFTKNNRVIEVEEIIP